MKLAQLQKLVDEKRSDLDWHHAVGRLLEELLPDRGYRKRKMEKLVKRLGGKNKKVSAAALYTAREFTRKYTARELRTLRGLTFAHVRRLIVIEDDGQRERYRQQCQKHGWSCRHLQAKIYERFGKRSEGFKRFKKVEKVGPKAALRKVLWLRDVTVKQLVPMLEQNHDLASQMSQRSDDDLRKLVSAACSALDELHSAVKEARTKLRQARTAAKIPGG
jgi:hypothetical protein